MFRELKESWSYSKAMFFFSVFSLIFCVAAGVGGELFLPLAGAFTAALFIFESPRRRVLSYVVPASALLISFLLNGIYCLGAVEAVIFAVIISVLYSKKASKGEVAFYLTLLCTAFIFIAFYFGAAKETGSFAPESVVNFYTESLAAFKDVFVEELSSYSITMDGGKIQYLFTEEEATLYFTAMINSLVSIIVVISFIIVGVTMKIYCAIMRRICKYGILKRFSHFGVNNIVSYFYILVAAFSLFVSSENSFDIAITNINTIFIFVFAYIGLKYVISMADFTGRKFLVYTLLVIAFLFLGATGLRILSYLGVFINISINKNTPQYSSGDGGQR